MAPAAPEVPAAPAVPPADPPGNNGTIKVDGRDFDSHQDNEPHVGCVFQIDFYGFDEGQLFADVTFEGQPPTGGGTLLTDTVFIGGDAAGGGGDLDASATYDLSAALAGIAPAEQGHHVKLTINADGSQGADVKHKVFWVEGCGGTIMSTTTTSTTAPPETTTTTAPPETTTTTAPPETTTTTAPSTTAPPTTAPPSTEPPSTEPPSTEPPTTTKPDEDEGFLARTGSEIGPIVGIGLGLLAVGALVALLARRRSV